MFKSPSDTQSGGTSPFSEHDTGSDTGATATYVRATTHEVATALAALTGEPHPLATQDGW